MKKLIQEESPNDIVFIDQINDSSIVGVYNKNQGKYYIAKNNNGFFGMQPFSLNQFAPWYKKTVKEYVEEINNGELYIFESEEELFNWLKQD